MKPQFLLPITVAAVSFALLCPQNVHARNPMQNANNSQASESAVSPEAQQEAAQMVPARAVLVAGIDARKTKAGQEFQATLGDTVRLKNGPELPRGTKLDGTVSTDNTQSGGPALALRFTKAELKDGKVVPIRAMIIGIFEPGDNPSDNPDIAAMSVWQNTPEKIDDLGVMAGVDLHSQIGSDNSGVFVPTKKNDVKLSSGFNFALAISAQQGG
jgi:hypothetical protein